MAKIMPVGSLSCLQATRLLSIVSSQHSLAPYLSLVLAKQVFWLRPSLCARTPSEAALGRQGVGRVPNYQVLQAPLGSGSVPLLRLLSSLSGMREFLSYKQGNGGL